MIVTKNRRHGVNFIKVWFAEEPVKDKGIITYRQAETEGRDAVPFETLITDLTETPEQIKGRFAKNCRYEVNRAEREDISVKIISGTDIKDEDIDGFISFFKEFWQSKSMDLDDPDGLTGEMRTYRDMGSLCLAMASIRGSVAVYHTYICDDVRCRLWHSASLYRLDDEEGDSRKLTGMANRYLHYRDMLYHKDRGLSAYDWGGAGTDAEVANITRFKESFGGVRKTCYEYEEVRGAAAHIFKFIVSAMDDLLLTRS